MKADRQLLSAEGTVPALRRAVQILDLLALGKRLHAADITRAMGLPKSTAHGLLAVMAELKLISKAEDGTFGVGQHPLLWANAFLSQLDIISTFQDYLGQCHDLDAYTVTLTVRDGAEVVYIGCRNSSQPLGYSFRIGMRLPAPFTATGKILLSALSPDDLKKLFPRFPEPLTTRSVTSLAALEGELASARVRGFSIDDGQIREGMVCIGSAIRDHSGAAVAGIAISLTISEAREDRITTLGQLLRKVADALSGRLGAHL